MRKLVYVKIYPEAREVIYSGIVFGEFVEYLPQSIENLMIVSGGCSLLSAESGNERGFELFEGRTLIKRLAKKNIYDLGNFCFVDYATTGMPRALSEEQLAELLYIGKMFKPLHSHFFDELQNRFAYLGHDDGWYGKLYCRNTYDFIDVLLRKITAHLADKGICTVTGEIREQMLRLAEDGLLIDFDELTCKVKGAAVNLYIIGEHSDMDAIGNNLQKAKDRALKIYTVSCEGQIFLNEAVM